MAIMEDPGLEGNDTELTALLLPLEFGMREDAKPLRVPVRTHMRVITGDPDLALVITARRAIMAVVAKKIDEAQQEPLDFGVGLIFLHGCANQGNIVLMQYLIRLDMKGPISRNMIETGIGLQGKDAARRSHLFIPDGIHYPDPGIADGFDGLPGAVL